MKKPWLSIELRNPPRTLMNWHAAPLALIYAPFLLVVGIIFFLASCVCVLTGRFR